MGKVVMKKLSLTILLALMALNIGCAKKSSPKATAAAPQVVIPPNGGPYVPPGTGPGEGPGSSFQYGGTASITIVSLSRMSEYTGRPMNNPQNIRLNINLTKEGSNYYGGVATIRYEENGYTYEGYFTSGSGDKARYNIWFNSGGQNVWHGVFEDFMGGLVVVIDQIIDLGDGGGAQDTVGGSIWFKNFGLTYAPHPPTYCWFVSLGPYDCRPWPSGDGMSTTMSADPQAGYKKLGTFSGLNVNEAFNGDFSL